MVIEDQRVHRDEQYLPVENFLSQSSTIPEYTVTGSNVRTLVVILKRSALSNSQNREISNFKNDRTHIWVPAVRSWANSASVSGLTLLIGPAAWMRKI